MIEKLPLRVLDYLEKRTLEDYEKTRDFLREDPELLEKISRRRALRAFKRAARKVPAYKRFLKEHKVKKRRVRNPEFFEGIVPITDKKNYVKKYNYEKRCVGGKFPRAGNIDESSGSTGKPTNWIRSVKEEEKLEKIFRFLFRHLLGEKERIVISCWSSGAWATGVKFCEIVERFALVKNIGTDIKKAEDTLKTFGHRKKYLIAGYPQFIKELLEQAKIRWKKYDISIITGGDGVVLGWNEDIRKMLGRGKIYSAYGSSDIDIGVANETDVTLEIRKRCSEDEELCEALFGRKDQVPMIFQYNPLMHHIQNKLIKGKREFVVTALDRNIASPKIKYAVHDEGGAVKYKEMMEKLARHKVNVKEDLKLPFLYVFGRSDGTISLDGANVYPQQVERAIREMKEGKKINNYMIEKKTDKRHKARFVVHVELKKEKKQVKKKEKERLRKRFEKGILEGLLKRNNDYKESYENNQRLRPRVRIYEMDQGPFKEDNKRLKHKYILEHE